MTKVRILLLSNTRPSRSWRLARRIASDNPGLEICGIVQRPLSALSPAQQLIATEGAGIIPPAADFFAALKSGLRSCFDALVHGVLRLVHGWPRTASAPDLFTVRTLAEKCVQHEWPFLETFDLAGHSTAEFIHDAAPHLIVALGDVPALPASVSVPPKGLLRACETKMRNASGGTTDGSLITIEHFPASSGPASSGQASSGPSSSVRCLASLTLPRQAYDTTLGFTLKADLTADDMLLRAVECISAHGIERASRDLADWVDTMFSPYLVQIGAPKPSNREPSRRWVRSIWSLSAETILLCSPAVVARNWMRRLQSRYPVLILAHHLVSDRGHRMSMSTEAFWRQVLFLRRHYRIVSLAKAAEILRSGRVRTPTVSLTFDDGYADNFVSLRAVADELDIPVSMFITTKPVELRTEFQHDLIKGDHGTFAMTWDQIRYWQARGAEFGSHTRTHIRCGFVDRSVLREEIIGSRDDFERNLGAAPAFFAFPYGDRANMPLEAMELAASAYPHFLSSYGGENFPDAPQGNAHLVRKKAYAEPWELELELQSVFDFVDTTKRALHVRNIKPSRMFGAQAPAINVSLDQARSNQLVAEPSQGIQRLVKPS